jgi:hypothetical protein
VKIRYSVVHRPSFVGRPFVGPSVNNREVSHQYEFDDNDNEHVINSFSNIAFASGKCPHIENHVRLERHELV